MWIVIFSFPSNLQVFCIFIFLVHLHNNRFKHSYLSINSCWLLITFLQLQVNSLVPLTVSKYKSNKRYMIHFSAVRSIWWKNTLNLYHVTLFDLRIIHGRHRGEQAYVQQGSVSPHSSLLSAAHTIHHRSFTVLYLHARHTQVFAIFSKTVDWKL